MDFKLESEKGELALTFEKASNVLNNIILSVTTRKGAAYSAPDFGSRVHELIGRGNTVGNRELARVYVAEALQWMVTSGRIAPPEITITQDSTDRGRVRLRVTAVQKNGDRVKFETFIALG